MTDELFDDLFHSCAFAAYVELATACGSVPDVEATRRLTCEYYAQELATSLVRPYQRVTESRLEERS